MRVSTFVIEGQRVVLRGDFTVVMQDAGRLTLMPAGPIHIEYLDEDLPSENRPSVYRAGSLVSPSELQTPVVEDVSFAKRLAQNNSLYRKPGLATHEYLRMILQAAGAPLRVSDFLDFLPFTAYKGRAKSRGNAGNTVRSSLSRRKDIFIKFPDASWGLVDRDEVLLEKAHSG